MFNGQTPELLLKNGSPVSDEELYEIASNWGTPSFVFDLEGFRTRLLACREIVGETVSLCYAMKANPFLINAAAECVSKLEVCSPGELALCERAGIAPDKIVYSGVNKELVDIAEAVSYRVGVLTAESILHVEYLNQVANERGVVVDVLLRLNAGSQFGMSREDLISVVERCDEYPNLNFVGIHYFVYTQRKKLKRQVRELGMLVDFIDELKRDYGFEAQRLEYGPGLGVPYFENEDFSDDLAPLRELAPMLREVAAKVELIVEMGRFFASPCGAYLTSVKDQKSNDGTNYVILDGGMNHLTYYGQAMGLHVPPISNVTKASRGTLLDDEVCEWCLCGSLCTVNDVLVREVELPDLRHDDVLAFRRAGAYSVTEGVYLFLSRMMPRVLLREASGEIVLARDFVESYELNGTTALG